MQICHLCRTLTSASFVEAKLFLLVTPSASAIRSRALPQEVSCQTVSVSPPKSSWDSFLCFLRALT